MCQLVENSLSQSMKNAGANAVVDRMIFKNLLIIILYFIN